MIVVSDTSPLAYLVEIGVADALAELYGGVMIPTAVADELRHPSSPARQWFASPPQWLTITAPNSSLPHLPLDDGELQAIALAIELKAELILIDERPGREAAKGLGLRVIGSLAVLVDGAARGCFDGIAALDRLAQTNFYVSPELMKVVRQRIEKFQK